MQPESIYQQADRQIWEEELESFVPARIFDAHIHLIDPRHIAKPPSSTSFVARSYAGMDTLKQWASVLYPGREAHFLTLGMPCPGIDVAPHNQWCTEQILQDPQSRLNILVTPSCALEEIRRNASLPGVVGLKPYRLFSVTGDVAQCRIHEFLPHAQLELANELGLWVTLHLSRSDACADEYNLRDLEEFTNRRYPRIRWILAHCARSFTYWPIRQGLARLRDMPNIYYDVSAVTDVRPLITLFSGENPRRIFYGSDGVGATYWPGQYTAFGRAWQAVRTDLLDLKFPHCEGRPILAIYEQLLSMKHAAEIAGWGATEIGNVFWNNAAEALGLKPA